MNTLQSAGYVVIHECTIWGGGKTEAEAAADARKWVSEGSVVPTEETKYHALRQAKEHSELYMIPATAALLNYYSEYGALDSWGHVDGIACTDEEESAANE
ncbi:hypothetical protein L6019_RS23450 [Escherichia coli]|nr:hypothetical protein [Escherichia coli]EKG7113509.1 hypothetical protein [Escherichia coli]ELM8776655.1 hypothetical protein [Escherichia coli]EMA4402840.1 hypothetical protein [Escherichia coli]HAH8501015.1 hypothetical protein [Escherichia coli]